MPSLARLAPGRSTRSFAVGLRHRDHTNWIKTQRALLAEIQIKEFEKNPLKSSIDLSHHLLIIHTDTGLMRLLVRMVAGTNHRPARRIAETHSYGGAFQLFESLRRYVA